MHSIGLTLALHMVALGHYADSRSVASCYPQSVSEVNSGVRESTLLYLPCIIFCISILVVILSVFLCIFLFVSLYYVAEK